VLPYGVYAFAAVIVLGCHCPDGTTAYTAGETAVVSAVLDLIDYPGDFQLPTVSRGNAFIDCNGRAFACHHWSWACSSVSYDGVTCSACAHEITHAAIGDRHHLGPEWEIIDWQLTTYPDGTMGRCPVAPDVWER